MKFSLVAFLAAVGISASAFAPPTKSHGGASLVRHSVLSEPTVETKEPETRDISQAEPLSAQTGPVDTTGRPELSIEEDIEVIASPEMNTNEKIVPGRYDSLDYSITLPFFQRPPKLDGSHAGDYGFDPLGFTEEYDLYYMQECELRHARLAMLAVIGWPLSELLGPDFMLQNGQAPSVLNGFNPISGGIILAFLAAFGLFEYNTALRRTVDTELGAKHASDMELVWNAGVAGDYNFDPLNLYSLLGDDAAGRKAMRSLEISHGRWAMMGIAGFAFLEALTKRPIVEDNLFFHPNPVLPLAAVSYLVWSQFYQVSDLREYPIKIEYTKHGEEMLRGIKSRFSDEE